MLNYSEKMINKIQKVQNRAMRLILGVNKYTHIKDMLEVLSWMNIKQKVIYNSCTLIHKVILNYKPNYLHKKIKKIDSKHKYETEKKNNINVLSTRTHSAEKSLAYKGFNYYNRLPDEIKTENRINIFRRLLKEYIKDMY